VSFAHKNVLTNVVTKGRIFSALSLFVEVPGDFLSLNLTLAVILSVLLDCWGSLSHGGVF